MVTKTILTFLLIVSASALQATPMKIETSAFREGQTIPKQYTCQGKNVSPPFHFVDAPKETVTFALIVNDPEAQNPNFSHWVVWNIPATTANLLEGSSIGDQGTNDFGEKGYQGPCPPPGKLHH